VSTGPVVSEKKIKCKGLGIIGSSFWLSGDNIIQIWVNQLIDFCCLSYLSAIFQLYSDYQTYWASKTRANIKNWWWNPYLGLKVALNTITLTLTPCLGYVSWPNTWGGQKDSDSGQWCLAWGQKVNNLYQSATRSLRQPETRTASGGHVSLPD
jgi:hypothetical protein